MKTTGTTVFDNKRVKVETSGAEETIEQSVKQIVLQMQSENLAKQEEKANFIVSQLQKRH